MERFGIRQQRGARRANPGAELGGFDLETVSDFVEKGTHACCDIGEKSLGPDDVRLRAGVRIDPTIVDPILDAFEREAAGVRFSPPRLQLVSNVTGKLADAGQVTQPAYWRPRNWLAVRSRSRSPSVLVSVMVPQWIVSGPPATDDGSSRSSATLLKASCTVEVPGAFSRPRDSEVTAASSLPGGLVPCSTRSLPAGISARMSDSIVSFDPSQQPARAATSAARNTVR